MVLDDLTDKNMLDFKYLEANEFKTGDKYLMFTNLNQVHLVTVSENKKWFDDPHGTKCTSVKVFLLQSKYQKPIGMMNNSRRKYF